MVEYNNPFIGNTGNRRERTVDDEELRVNGYSIQEVYELHCNDKFVVNRRYQRKLVWELEEKQYFVDTILRKFPIPSFVFVSYKDESNIRRYEVIDGLQRLELIISFLECGFPVIYEGKECYFDLSSTPSTLERKLSGKLEQKEPMLPMNLCRIFAVYRLPFSITEMNDESVEEIFRRINSTGRKLSSQDLRQAGSIGRFSELVRRVSSGIRGDATKRDVLPLSDMQKYSLSNRRLNYGIDINEVFWVKQGILTRYNMRRSQDEEMVAYLLSYIIEGKDAFPTTKHLDDLYDIETDFSKRVEKKLSGMDCAALEDQFLYIVAEVRNIFSSVRSVFGEWCFSDPKSGKKGRCFQILFLSLYNLTQEGMKIVNYSEVAKALKYFGNRELSVVTSGDSWTHELRQRMVENTSGLLRSKMRHVSESDYKNDRRCIELERILGYAKVEQQMYDFKQGVISDGKFNKQCLERIGKTLVAIANTNEGQGVVYKGVSDGEQSAVQFEDCYGVRCCVCNDWYINGVDSEAKSAGYSLDQYLLCLKDRIKALPINGELKDYILRNFAVIDYYGRTVIVLYTQALSVAATYEGNLYVRNGSSTEKVLPGSAAFNSLMRRIYARPNTEDTVKSMDVF